MTQSIALDQTRPDDNQYTSMTVNEAHRDWVDILEKVAANDEHIVLSKDGKEIAAIISMEAFHFLQRAIAMVEDEIDLEAIRSAKIEIEREGTVSWEALRAELSL